MTESSRAYAKRITTEAVEAVQAALGDAVHVERGRVTYDDNAVTMKIVVSRVDAETGEAMTPARRDFERYCGIFGLEPGDLGATFKSRGRTYTIVGLKTRARTYPILAERDDGQSFKFPADAVLRGLGR